MSASNQRSQRQFDYFVFSFDYLGDSARQSCGLRRLKSDRRLFQGCPHWGETILRHLPPRFVKFARATCSVRHARAPFEAKLADFRRSYARIAPRHSLAYYFVVSEFFSLNRAISSVG